MGGLSQEDLLFKLLKLGKDPLNIQCMLKRPTRHESHM